MRRSAVERLPGLGRDVAVADVPVAAAVSEDGERAGVAAGGFPRRVQRRLGIVDEDARLVGIAGMVDVVEDQVDPRIVLVEVFGQFEPLVT